jgi:hypothetical protein
MPHIFEQKNTLLVPLSLFIRYNKQSAGQRFANLLGKFTDELFNSAEEIKAHDKFSEKLIQKILTSKLVSQFNLGKKTKVEFISELLNFLNLPKSKSNELEIAWNSLVDFDEKSNEQFKDLINFAERGKSIYFVADSNELHAEKIMVLFNEKSTTVGKNLPIDITPKQPIEILENIYFCPSYTYGALIENQSINPFFGLFTKSKPNLISLVQAALNSDPNTLLFVEANQKDKEIAQKLGLETTSVEEFYTALQAKLLSLVSIEVNQASTAAAPNIAKETSLGIFFATDISSSNTDIANQEADPQAVSSLSAHP